MRLFENGKLVLARLFASPTEAAPPDDGKAVSDERRVHRPLRRLHRTRQRQLIGAERQ